MKKYIRLYMFILSILSGFLASCNPQYQNAKILMDGQEYEAAEHAYRQILSDDPSDAEATVGVRRARLGWIDNKLLDVRMLRLSDQTETSFDLLKEIIKREREWQFFPEGAVQFTQLEEIEHAARYVEVRVESLIGKRHLLKARDFVGASSPVLQSPRNLLLIEKLARALGEAATQECRGYEESLTEKQPYFATFVVRYCASWGHKAQFRFDPAQARSSNLYRDLHVSGSADTIPDAMLRHGLEQMVKEFRETPWFDANGQLSLETQVIAAFESNQNKEIENALHTYTVNVPYLETEIVPLPAFGYQQVCDAYGYCHNAPHSNLSFQPVTVTKYRQESRQVSFQRWRHRQALFFQGEVISTLANMKASAIHTEKLMIEDTEHPHAAPEVGLQPDPLQLKDPLPWLMTQIDTAAEKWKQELGTAWEVSNCEKPEEATLDDDLSNYVFRCLHGLKKDARIPAFIETFFQDKFGATQQVVDGWMTLK